VTSRNHVDQEKNMVTKKMAVKKMAVKKNRPKPAAKRRPSAKRELIDTGNDKRYVRRDGKGRFDESDDVGRSLAQDRRRHAKAIMKSGYGDRGDQRRK
jgi:hypothetical protein